MSTRHPRRDGAGRWVPIRRPSTPSPASAWGDPSATVVVPPGGIVPAELHGIPFEPKSPPDRGWWGAAAASAAVVEPPFACPPHLQPAAGILLIESDQRVWLARPTNRFGGVAHVVPKGRIDRGETPAAAAMRECWQETGLLVHLDGHLLDLPRSTTFVRYYIGRRVAGSPAAMGWESEASVLAPPARLGDLLNGPHDAALVAAAVAHIQRRTWSRPSRRNGGRDYW